MGQNKKTDKNKDINDQEHDQNTNPVNNNDGKNDESITTEEKEILIKKVIHMMKLKI